MLVQLQIKLFLHEGLLWLKFRTAAVEKIFKLLSKIHAFFKLMEALIKPIDLMRLHFYDLPSRFECYRGEYADLKILFISINQCFIMLMHDRLVLRGIVTYISSDGIWLCCAMRSLCILVHVCPCSLHKNVSFFSLCHDLH